MAEMLSLFEKPIVKVEDGQSSSPLSRSKRGTMDDERDSTEVKDEHKEEMEEFLLFPSRTTTCLAFLVEDT